MPVNTTLQMTARIINTHLTKACACSVLGKFEDVRHGTVQEDIRLVDQGLLHFEGHMIDPESDRHEHCFHHHVGFAWEQS